MTHPPSGPSTPPPPSGPKLAVDLDHAELLLRSVQVLVAALDGMDPALRMRLANGLRTARRAVSAAQTPARPHLSSAAAVAGGPVQPRAGEPPLPGADFRLPRDVRPVRA